jgi:uncharacterized protein (TIGR02145 family)
MNKVNLILSSVLLTALILSSCGCFLSNESATAKEVMIGKQVWMTKNLNVEKFRNGDSILEAKTLEDWTKADKSKQPAWCYYKNDPTIGEKYGKLYNWYAVNDSRGLAPEGWKIPSDKDWSILINYLDTNAVGGDNFSNIAGGKMKFTGTQYWQQPNTDADNTSGFSGLPGGFRDNYGTFGNISKYGYWWSSTESTKYSAWSRILYYNYGSVARNYDAGNYGLGQGLSVRCLRE